jgi:hypothetical protein
LGHRSSGSEAIRGAPRRRVPAACFGALFVFGLACSSNKASPPQADAGTDNHNGDVASEAWSGCVCGSARPAVSNGACAFSSLCPPSDFFRVSVKLDGAAVPRDQTRANGWDYTNAEMTSIQLFGPSCQALTNGSATGVMFDYSCVGP